MPVDPAHDLGTAIEMEANPVRARGFPAGRLGLAPEYPHQALVTRPGWKSVAPGRDLEVSVTALGEEKT